jgi:hypothetical protein
VVKIPDSDALSARRLPGTRGVGLVIAAQEWRGFGAEKFTSPARGKTTA